MTGMKKILAIIFYFCLFISPSNSNDIDEFQLDGINIGQSLLELVDKKYIEAEKYYAYENKKMFQVPFTNQDKSSKYEGFQFSIFENDKNFIIESVEGFIFMKFTKCKDEMKKVSNDIRYAFPSLKTSFKPFQKSDDGTVYAYNNFYITGGHSIRVICTDHPKKLEEDFGYEDNLRVVINSAKFNNWLNEESFKP
jgi:hypothetical protein